MKLADYYDSIARNRTRYYQEATGLARLLLHGPVERHVERCVARALVGIESLADVGCGFGKYLDGLERVRRVLLNDLSPEMLATAREKLRTNYPEMELSTRLGSMFDVELEPERGYDLVISIGVINHFTDEELRIVLRKLSRLAAKKVLLYYAHEGFILSSRVGVSFHRQGMHYQCHSRSVVAAALAEAGFHTVDSSYLLVLPLVSPLVMQEFRRTRQGD